jgi:hypothetical protein
VAPALRYARFDLAHVVVDGIGIPLKAAYLLLAQPENTDQLQWECLVYALDDEPLARGTYRADLTMLDGRELAGDAVVVRSVEGAHVPRGRADRRGLQSGTVAGCGVAARLRRQEGDLSVRARKGIGPLAGVDAEELA